MALGRKEAAETSSVLSGFGRHGRHASRASQSVSRFLIFLFALSFALLVKPDVPNTLEQFGLTQGPPRIAWNVAVVMISVAMLVPYVLRVRIDLFGGFSILLAGLILVSTVCNGQQLDYWAVYILPCSAVSMLVVALSVNYSRELLWGMLCASLFYLIGNLVFIALDFAMGEVGVQNYMFYGYRNNTFQIALPAFASSLLLDAGNGKKWSARTGLIFAAALFEVLVGYSATSAFALIVTGCVSPLILCTPVKKWLNGLTMLVGYLVSFAGVVLLRLQQAGSFFFEGILGRDITFTGRTMIWDKALESLGGVHLLVGRGTAYALKVGDTPYYAHNDFLHVTLMGGLGALVAQLALLGLTFRRLFVRRDELLSACYVLSLLPFLIIALTESVFCPGFYFLLSMAYSQVGKAGFTPSRPAHSS